MDLHPTCTMLLEHKSELQKKVFSQKNTQENNNMFRKKMDPNAEG